MAKYIDADKLRAEEESLGKTLDEAAHQYAWNKQEHHIDFDGDEYLDYGPRYDAFIAGAEWMAGQGETIDGSLCYDPHLQMVIVFLEDCPKMWEGSIMDVTVQIRKKED